MTKELMKQSLEALQGLIPMVHDWYGSNIHNAYQAIGALEEALKQEQDEPVAYGFPNSAITGNQKWMLLEEKIPENDQYKGALWIPLYTTPQTKEWVSLTNEQIEEIWGNTPMMLNSHNNRTRIFFAKAIDAKLKEKNGY